MNNYKLESEPDPIDPPSKPTAYGTLDLRLADCMDVMREFPDGYFDLAIVDPPYGIDKKMFRTSMGACGGGQFGEYSSGSHRWDKETPPAEYWEELFRVSRNQIVCGGNYFPLPPTRGVVCWDKMKQVPNFSQWEMIWTSFDNAAAIFKFMWHGNYCGYDGNITLKTKSVQMVHPTQKPIQLYEWLLAKYAKEGDRILDTHLGSGSIAIAAHYARMHLTACEIDPDYFHAAKARIVRETAQTVMFLPNV